jgi:hypothetical protein
MDGASQKPSERERSGERNFRKERSGMRSVSSGKGNGAVRGYK